MAELKDLIASQTFSVEGLVSPTDRPLIARVIGEAVEEGMKPYRSGIVFILLDRFDKGTRDLRIEPSLPGSSPMTIENVGPLFYSTQDHQEVYERIVNHFRCRPSESVEPNHILGEN